MRGKHILMYAAGLLWFLGSCTPQVRTVPQKDYSAQINDARQFIQDTKPSPSSPAKTPELASCLSRLQRVADSLTTCNAENQAFATGLRSANDQWGTLNQKLAEVTAKYNAEGSVKYKWAAWAALMTFMLTILLYIGLRIAVKAGKLSAGGLLG